MPRQFLLVTVLAVIVAFFMLGSPRLFDVDEAVFSQATKEMVRSGNWITPTYNGANRYDKPVLFYWLMAPSYKAFGVNEFGARFPSASAAVVLALTLYLFLRRREGGDAAFAASLALTCSLYYAVYARSAVVDMVLTLFITLSLLLFHASLSAERGRTWYLSGFYLFSALAFLTKGLIGIVFPFGIALVYLAAAEGLGGVRRVFSAQGIVLFLLVGTPWYIVQYAVNGNEFIQQFFVKHHFQRYADVISGHKGPFYFYLPVVTLGLFPWIGHLPAGIRQAVKERRGIGFLALVWFSLVFIFFSFSTTKLPNYILPSIPAACILIGAGMRADGLWRRFADGFVVVVAFAMALGFVIGRPYALKAGLADVTWMTGAAVIAGALATTALWSIFSRRRLYGVQAVIMLSLIILLLARALPAANVLLQGTLHTYSTYAKERLGPGENLIAYKLNKPSLLFYADRPMVHARNEEEFAAAVRDGAAKVVIVRVKDAEPVGRAGFTQVESDGRYALFERK